MKQTTEWLYQKVLNQNLNNESYSAIFLNIFNT